MSRRIIHTDHAPAAIGIYSQAVQVDQTVYLSGQIGLDPQTMTLSENFETQLHQVFRNVAAVCEAAGGTLQDMVKVNIFLTDLANFQVVNQIMSGYFSQPFPARAAIGVASLPRAAQVEIDGVMYLDR